MSAPGGAHDRTRVAILSFARPCYDTSRASTGPQRGKEEVSGWGAISSGKKGFVGVPWKGVYANGHRMGTKGGRV